jgi:hypothetical protein
MIKEFPEKGVEIRIVDREEIIRGLGFNHDIADRELIEITDVGLYRVQGEVILNVVSGLESVEEFYKMMMNRGSIVSYVNSYLMNYIALTLIDLGFSIDIPNSIVLRNIIHSNIVEKPEKIMKILEALGNSIIKHLKKYMEIYAIRYGEEKNEYSDIYVVYYTIASNIGVFELRLSFNYFRPRPFTLPYSDIVVNVRADYDLCRLCKDIEQEFINTMRNTPRQNYKMLIGNHIVELKNVYSGDIIFRPSRRLEIELFRLPVISNNINSYYVDRESEIIVTHREHGVTKIRFSRPFLVNFTTTIVHHQYNEKLNRVVLHNIINGFYNDRKVTEYLKSYGDS